MKDPGYSCAPTGANVDHCSHRGAGTGYGAEETSHRIANSLPNELSVAFVPGARHIVGHQRGEQAIYGPQQRQDDGASNNDGTGLLIYARYHEVWQAYRYVTKGGSSGQETADDGTNHQCHQRPRNLGRKRGGPKEDDAKGDGGNDDRRGVQVLNRIWDRSQRRQGTALFGSTAKQA